MQQPWASLISTELFFLKQNAELSTQAFAETGKRSIETSEQSHTPSYQLQAHMQFTLSSACSWITMTVCYIALPWRNKAKQNKNGCGE